MTIRPNSKTTPSAVSQTIRYSPTPISFKSCLSLDHQQPHMTVRKMPGSGGGSSKYMFRFTQDEIAEMDNLLEETNNANPSAKVFNAFAIKFSKTRHQHGLSYVRPDSVQNWFRKRRHMIRKAAKALSSLKSTKPSDPNSAAIMEKSPIDELKSDGEEASSTRSSEKESSEGGTFGEEASGHIGADSSVSNSAEIVDRMDVQPQPVSLLQIPVSDVDSVLARLAKFKRAQPEASLKTSYNELTDATHSSGIDARDIVLQAKLTLGRMVRMNLVDFKSYQRDFDAAVSIIVEKGFLSDKEKSELLLLRERILSIVKENEYAREELSKCNSFKEKLTETAESANKIMMKADLLKEKYNKIPQDMSVVSRKISQLEAALVQAKGELEIMKGDQEDVANRLAELSQSLDSVNKHYKSLKADEATMIKKRARIEEKLVKNSEEWVQLTNSTGFTVYKGGP